MKMLFLVALMHYPAASAFAVYRGRPAASGQWPSVVAITYYSEARSEGRLICTGTRIAPRVILTAAHCFSSPAEALGFDVKRIDKHLKGFTIYDGPGAAGGFFVGKTALTHVEIHPKEDIAVVHTAEAADGLAVSAVSSVAGLRSKEAPMTVSGFGYTGPKTLGFKTYKKVRVSLLENSLWSQDSGSCLGDSGGPAFLDSKKGPVLMGVSALGMGDPEDPCGEHASYTAVTDEVLSWIKAHSTLDLRKAADSPALKSLRRSAK